MPPFERHGNTVDPDNARPGQVLDDAANTNYILLQTSHHPDAEETQELGRRGLEMLSLEQETGDTWTYLCRYEPTDLDPLRALPFVKAAFVYHTDLVIHPLLLQPDSHAPELGDVHRETITNAGSVESTESSAGNAVEVVVTLHKGSRETGEWVFQQLQDACSDHEAPGLRVVASDTDVLRAWVPESKLQQLAALDCVAAVHPAYDAQPRTVVARTLMGMPGESWTEAALGRMTWPGQRFQGSGQIVAISDSGLDYGILVDEPLDPVDVNNLAEALTPAGSFTGPTDAIRQAARTTLENAAPPPGYSTLDWTGGTISRIQNPVNKANFVVRAGQPAEAQSLCDTTGHGSHVAGCVAGDYISPLMRWNRRRVTGTAPSAKLYIQKDAGTAGARANQATVNGARIQNYSWGLGKAWQLPYSPGGQEVDQVTQRYPNLLVVYAAGNSGDVMKREAEIPAVAPAWNKQVGAESAAKNALVVGATWSERLMPPAAPVKVNYGLDDGGSVQDTRPRPVNSDTLPVDTLAGFSEKGPTLEGLLKPDVLAPGVGILSMRSRAPPGPAVAPAPTRNQPKYSPDPWTIYESGTSMSAPLVSGLAACLREALAARLGAEVPARTLRAIIVNAAESMEGKAFTYNTGASAYDHDELGEPPDCAQGFGRVSYPRSIAHVPAGLYTSSKPPLRVSFRDTPWGFCQYFSVKANNEVVIHLRPGASAVGRTFAATLVYDDQPGALLQHVLNLRISVFAETDAGDTQLGHDVDQRAVQILPGYVLPAGRPPVQLGTVRKAYWPGPLPPPGAGATLDIRLTISAARTMPSTRAVPFTVAWLTE